MAGSEMAGNGKREYDVVVVGAGPAGLMAGICAAERGLDTAVVEKMERPCRKLLISGKGRCNLINRCDTETFLQNIRQGARFLYSSYTAFGAPEIMAFFEERGIPLKVERGNRVFPQSDRSADIADALVKAAQTSGCDIRRHTVTGVAVRDGAVCGVETPEGPLRCRGVIVATGGLSYPKTGSTGDGYRFARAAGHTVAPLAPSLVPLTCGGEDCRRMMGLSLRNVRLTARQDGKTIYSEQGEMLFTHFGISGPLVLSLSGYLVSRGTEGLSVSVDLKPALDRATLDKRLLRDFGENANRALKNSLAALLPQKMIPVIIEKTGVDPDKKIHAVTAAERAALVELIKTFPLKVTGRRPIEEAVVTAGGVSLREIDPKTMMSKIVHNLHFAGEVLDADGFTGGFNLGIAFATGHAAGSFVLKGEDQ